MAAYDLLEKLLKRYRSNYDIEQPFFVEDELYDAYAKCHVSGVKYVLIKKAELWRANCHEHVFFRCFQRELTAEELEKFRKQIQTAIEPKLVRGGEKYPQKDHMYTYITCMYLCGEGLSKEAKKAVKHFRFMKNYMCTLRGYSEARILVFDLKEKKLYGNPAAKSLIKEYKKII